MDKSNILIVDHQPKQLLALTSVLEDLGQNLVAVRSGEEARRHVQDSDFAVILLAIDRHGTGGLETAALIRRCPKSAHTPMIFITASPEQVHAAGHALGAVDYMFSPIVPEILRTKVKALVDLYGMTQAAEEAKRRSMFLADASKVLSGSLDYEGTLRDLLRLTVPYLADLGAITLADTAGQPGTTEVAWLDETGQTASAAATPEGMDPELTGALRQVLETGEATHLAEFERPAAHPSPWQPSAGNGDVGNCLPNFALHSLLLMPLMAHGNVLGVLWLAAGRSGRRYGAADLVLAADLAGRAAVAIDNARLYRDVQRADAHKNAFLATLAHELRNPLAPIRTAVQILRLRGSREPELLAIQDMIDRQVQHLANLVDDLLDVSRITRGKVSLQREPIDLATVVARAVEVGKPLIAARRHTLTVSVPETAVCVEGDPVRLAQVLGNLLNNAAKYTKEGGHIWLSLEREECEAILRVRDSGVGIPQEMLGSVFDLFTQAEHAPDRTQDGLRIGLTLVRQLVELHGGRVQALSEGPGRGSEFIVALPLLADAPAAESPATEPPAPGAIVRRRVLVVDDNRDAADSLALLLRLAGHEVHVCLDGPMALEVARTYLPEAVLLDIGLPGMDGFEVARQLRSRAEMRDTMLVAITGYGQEQDLRHSREAGFDCHLVKPVDPATLTTLFSTAFMGQRR